jgi:hypothetical protein
MIDQKDNFWDYRAQRMRFEWVSLLVWRGGLEPFRGDESGSKILENGGDLGIS